MNFKPFLPYIVAISVFIVVSLFYFHPVLEGKKIHQSDIIQFTGSSKEIVDFRNAYKAEPYWTNATFGGMPSYAVSTYYPHNYIQKLDKIIRFLPRPADYLFLYFIGFFILLLTLKVEWKLAIVGALGFGLSTYLIIILGVGHNAKAHAIAYMPIVLAGVLMVFQKRYWLGFLVTTLALSFEISANHVQMTYYLFFLILILGIVQFIASVKEKQILEFSKKTSILIGAAILALGVNATSLMATQEYAQNSTRSKSELTITADGTKREITTGLDRSYITEYSYGKTETFNLFISRFMGGSRHEVVENSALREFLQASVDKGLKPDDANYLFQIASMYWGDQPIVAAPAYIGAIFIFLFVLALFLVKGKLKYWLVAATVFSILMSWGKNLAFLTDFFIDYVPLYNKFRAVSSIQVIAELTIPLLGILGLATFLSSKTKKEQKFEALKWAVLIIGGLALIFTLGGSSLFAFETPIDIQIDAQISGFLNAIVTDRQSLFFDDSLRSLILVAVTSGGLWLFLQDKIKKNIVVVGLGILILFDLINVDKRYVNEDSFTTSRRVEKPFQMSAIDKEILKDKSYYRIIDYTKNPMLDGGTSYFHKSLGGYHAAKPRRYQELYDFHIAKKNSQVLNMLNTKYIVDVNKQQQVGLQQNTEANGNAWFVSSLKVVVSADEEIKALDSLDTKTVAVLNNEMLSNRFNSDGIPIYTVDSTAVIKLTEYKANQLKYTSSNANDGFAVFSEIYYKNGWNAYIDGKSTTIYRVNYVLRAIEIPKGKHTIEFKFEPKVIQQGSLITLISYVLLIGIIFGWYFYDKKKYV